MLRTRWPWRPLRNLSFVSNQSRGSALMQEQWAPARRSRGSSEYRLGAHAGAVSTGSALTSRAASPRSRLGLQSNYIVRAMRLSWSIILNFLLYYIVTKLSDLRIVKLSLSPPCYLLSTYYSVTNTLLGL